METIKRVYNSENVSIFVILSFLLGGICIPIFTMMIVYANTNNVVISKLLGIGIYTFLFQFVFFRTNLDYVKKSNTNNKVILFLKEQFISCIPLVVFSIILSLLVNA